jgi:putative RecB family exonuclease
MSTIEAPVRPSVPKVVSRVNTMRPHWSFSQLSQYLRCPLQYYFERILKIERPYAPSVLVLGSSVHEALAEYHRLLQAEQPIPAGHVQESFLTAWQANEDRQPIQFKDNETKDELLAQGVALLELYMQEPPPQNIVAVEEALMVPLFTSSGECLEKPLLAVLDLLNRDDHGLVVSEYKTASRKYGESETETKPQATAYSHAIQQRYDEKPGIRYVVLVKTKKPSIQYVETMRNEADACRLGDIIQTVERAIEAQVFYPNESPMTCSGCQFYRHCREWRGCNSSNLYTVQKPKEATC